MSPPLYFDIDFEDKEAYPLPMHIQAYNSLKKSYVIRITLDKFVEITNKQFRINGIASSLFNQYLFNPMFH